MITRHLETHTQFTEVFNFIERNLGADLRLGLLARTYGTTADAFSMAFSRSTGITPKDYLTRRLNQEALRWVINSDLKAKTENVLDALKDSMHQFKTHFPAKAL